MLCPAPSFYTFGLSVMIRCVQGEIGASHCHFLFLPSPRHGLWWAVQGSGPFPSLCNFCWTPGCQVATRRASWRGLAQAWGKENNFTFTSSSCPRGIGGGPGA